MGRRRGGGKEDGAGRKGSKDYPWTLVGLCEKKFHDRNKRRAEVYVREYSKIHDAEMGSRGSCKVLLVSDQSMYGRGNNSSLCCLHVHFSFCLVISRIKRFRSPLASFWSDCFAARLPPGPCFGVSPSSTPRKHSNSVVYPFGKVRNGSKS